MSEQSDRITNFVGLVIMAASALWTAFSGYCIVDGVYNLLYGDDMRSAVGMFFAPAGVIGVAIGYGITRLGHSLWRVR